jgi:hypothetical protein
MNGQSIIGAQPPLGENGQMLQTEITRLHHPDLQHLSSHVIGEESNNSIIGNEIVPNNNVNQEENMLAVISNNRVRTRSLTPPPP